MIAGALALGATANAGGITPPHSPDGSAIATLFASEPDIVTPIGATIDSHGHLLVIESQSHFRTPKYHGPPTDRIRIFNTIGDAAKPNEIGTYFQGTNGLMNLVACPDGSVVVSSRNEIFRLTGDPPQKQTLARLTTTANYPHNGFHGLAVASDGSIYFAIGENLGAPWTAVGADGKSLQGNTGSGTIFHMDAQGHGLTRIARGMWNAFGLGFDPSGTLWAVDNDPDGRPPSRLLQIVPGADFGFEFRFGRTGLHPMQAWDGELPGTMGMVSGVGEAPCAVCWHFGRLFVSSWRDHKIEMYTLVPHGATYRAEMQPLLIGGLDFRPAGLAFTADGTLFISDWGSGSYEINGIGRIWKVTFKPPAPADAPVPRDSAMDRADHLRQSTDVAELTAALGHADPAIRQAAQFGLSQLPAIDKISLSSLPSPGQRIGLLTALLWRGGDMSAYVADALNDPSVDVREMGVRVISEQTIKSARPALEKLFDSPFTSPRLLRMTIATLAELDGDPAGGFGSPKIAQLLIDKLDDQQTPAAVKIVILRTLSADPKALRLDQIQLLLQAPTSGLQMEAVRSLAASPDEARLPLLAQIAADVTRYSGKVRAEAIDGLAADAANNIPLLLQATSEADTTVQEEAMRSLRPAANDLTDAQKQQLEAVVVRDFTDEKALLDRDLGRPFYSARPADDDLDAWEKILDAAPGDPAAGRRIFFHPAGPGCYRCHVIEGRGHVVGPDLTMIGHSQERRHILESILLPSREIAPLFTYWTIKLKSGRTFDGLLVRRNGQENEVWVDGSGQETVFHETDIIERTMRKESLMPSGLVAAMTDQELRDVVAYLTQKR